MTGLLLAGLGAAARQPVAMHHLTATISYAFLWAIYMFHAGRMRRKGLPASPFVVGSATAYVVVAAVPLAGNGNREWCVQPLWSGLMQVAISLFPGDRSGKCMGFGTKISPQFIGVVPSPTFQCAAGSASRTRRVRSAVPCMPGSSSWRWRSWAPSCGRGGGGGKPGRAGAIAHWALMMYACGMQAEPH
jgi:hypothetical protein